MINEDEAFAQNTREGFIVNSWSYYAPINGLAQDFGV